MAWRLAYSLTTLRDQVNAAYPARSKISDGTIGDAAHAAEPSDHNPNSAGVVCALDLTHNPPYFDAHALADKLLSNRNPNLKYLISNRRITGAWSQWRWVGYAGSNPHDKHIHISVGLGPDGQSRQPYDDTTKWNIMGGGDTLTKEQIIAIYTGFYDVEDAEVPSDIINAYTGKPADGLLTQLKNDPTWLAHKQQIRQNAIDAKFFLSVANVRGANFTRIREKLNIAADPDEGKTTNLILAAIDKLKAGVGVTKQAVVDYITKNLS